MLHGVQNTTAMYYDVTIQKRKILLIIDSGAAGSIVTLLEAVLWYPQDSVKNTLHSVFKFCEQKEMPHLAFSIAETVAQLNMVIKMKSEWIVKGSNIRSQEWKVVLNSCGIVDSWLLDLKLSSFASGQKPLPKSK
ncbi:13302_t:CDS:2 [Rhizophagus irregularis]|nr:13302_t:CDS:2 [Rhizophagus irregularis]